MTFRNEQWSVLCNFQISTTQLRRTSTCLLALTICFCVFAHAPSALGQKISSISVGPSLPVLGPDHSTKINLYGGLTTLSDEHSTIFPPGTLPFQLNYLFLVATRTQLAPDASGLVMLTNVSMPDPNGQWSLDFAPSYGLYQPSALPGDQNGPEFATAMGHSNCPVSGSDPTFDLNYAAPASAFVDPTNPWDLGGGNLLLVYEGTNRCIGVTGTSVGGNNFYSTIGIATSKNFGLTWPVYRANFTALPGINASEGPMAENGAWGQSVCWGNFCPTLNAQQPPAQYGRYAVSGPVTTISDAISESPNGLSGNTGDSEPAAFVDDVHGGSPSYVYVVHTYNPGPFEADSQLYPDFPTVQFDLSISRLALNGGKARLQATKWYQGDWKEPGLGSDGGGHESPIFPHLDDKLTMYQHCLAPSQSRSSASISFSDSTNEYVLLFVCVSPSEPQNEITYQSGSVKGGAWFYSTIDADHHDLSQQDQWSIPNEVTKSWSLFGNGCGKDFNGWYPTLMSINARPGHLAMEGYAFYMDGCAGAETTNGRVYSTRAFTIQTQ